MFKILVTRRNTRSINECSISSCKVLTIDNVNPYIKSMTSPIRNKIYAQAERLEQVLIEAQRHLPFDKILRADLLDPQAVNHYYVSYARQLIALLTYRGLLNSKQIAKDVKRRAIFLKQYLNFHSVGSCGRSNGLSVVRHHVANYISKRDGVAADRHEIVLCSGITDSFRSFIKLLNNKPDGKLIAILLPNPHHPIYSTLVQTYGMKVITYNLKEEDNWEIDINHLKETITCARKQYRPRALVIINPDSVTGNVISLERLKQIVTFAYEERLILIADETFHNNTYTKLKFFSVRKVQKMLGRKYRDLEIASMMSLSNGWFGECGIRAGYIELANFSPRILEVYLNCLRITRRPNVLGQIMLDCLVHPPLKNHESYNSFMDEKSEIRKQLKNKSEIIVQELNLIGGIYCNPIRGGICGFPRIDLPIKAIKIAEQRQLKPDEYFAMEFLGSKGISVIPGSTLCCTGQNHVCLSILPKEEDIKTILFQMKTFYNSFCKNHKSLYVI